MYSYGPPHMAGQKQDDQLKHSFSSYVIQDVALKTYQKRWTIGRSSEIGSEISVLAARHDDDDDFLTGCLTKAKEPNLFAYCRENNRFMPLVLSETPTTSFKIWTLVVDSIFNDELSAPPNMFHVGGDKNMQTGVIIIEECSYFDISFSILH